MSQFARVCHRDARIGFVQFKINWKHISHREDKTLLENQSNLQNFTNLSSKLSFLLERKLLGCQRQATPPSEHK